jgi:hypothetical protein
MAKNRQQQPAKTTAKPAAAPTAAPVPAAPETSEAPVTEAQASTAPAAPEPTAVATDAVLVTTDASPDEAPTTTPPAPVEASTSVNANKGEQPPASDENPALGDDAPPAADETPPVQDDAPAAGVVPATVPRPRIDTILGDLARNGTGTPGYVSRSPHLHLTAEQAELLAAIFGSLARHGVTLRDQGDAVGWLLDEINASLKEVG